MSTVGGGTEKHVLDISGALARRGHAVTIACPPESRFSQRVDELGLRRVAFRVQSAYDWKQIPGLIRVLASNYDVVHTHLPIDYAASAIAARLRCLPAIVMTRHMPVPFASHKNAYICSSILYDRIIAVSGFVQNVLIGSGGRADRIDVVHHGIASAAPDRRACRELREEFNVPADAMLIAAAGRMSPGKGFDVLLKAVRQVNRHGVTAYCVIFGGGASLESLRTLVADLHLASNVRLPGFRTDVNALLCAADVAVIPSVEPESFSYVAIEALASGCAVVASAIGALPEVLSQDSAILTRPGDVDSMAAAIRDLVCSPDRRTKMQLAGRHRASLFTLDAAVTGIERVYARALNQ